MMCLRKRRLRNAKPIERVELEQQNRLVDAEKRANALFVRAEWVYTVVARRDQDNHWQDSVNRLFLGGQP